MSYHSLFLYEATKFPRVYSSPTFPGNTIYGTSAHLEMSSVLLSHSGTPVAACPITIALFIPNATVAVSLLVIPPCFTCLVAASDRRV